MPSVLIWLHVAFAVFTVGPSTALTMSAPRVIRTKNVAVLQNLQRMNRIYSIGVLGVLLFGIWAGIAIGDGKLGEWYMTASMTLFIVALVLLFLIDRDLRIAVRALSNETPSDDAKVQNGRIAALSGIVSLIWLVILFLMVVPE
ncbi:hypothetical protein ACIBH1_39995 [Nonomuraea sp. NPDC050663]|uniref:hypothetical protein n=1 Tax=Nonomuraea sp. NPDC050663 TaxID=3364370 RepID=UPI00379E3B81